jgi:hypothetical protein
VRHRVEPRKSGAGFEIVELDHDDDVEFLARVVRYYGANATSLGKNAGSHHLRGVPR